MASTRMAGGKGGAFVNWAPGVLETVEKETAAATSTISNAGEALKKRRLDPSDEHRSREKKGNFRLRTSLVCNSCLHWGRKKRLEMARPLKKRTVRNRENQKPPVSWPGFSYQRLETSLQLGLQKKKGLGGKKMRYSAACLPKPGKSRPVEGSGDSSKNSSRETFEGRLKGKRKQHGLPCRQKKGMQGPKKNLALRGENPKGKTGVRTRTLCFKGGRKMRRMVGLPPDTSRRKGNKSRRKTKPFHEQETSKKKMV